MSGRKCGHKRSRYGIAQVFVPTRADYEGHVDRHGFTQAVGQHRCESCGEVVPLGPARDTREVIVEVEAARLAVEWSERGGHPRCSNETLENDCPVCGWYAHLGDVSQATDRWHAGYLAGCIAGHNTREIAEGGE